MITGWTDRQTDRQTGRQSATQYAAPPREEGHIKIPDVPSGLQYEDGLFPVRVLPRPLDLLALRTSLCLCLYLDDVIYKTS